MSNVWQYYMFKWASRLLCLLPYSLLLKIGALLGRTILPDCGAPAQQGIESDPTQFGYFAGRGGADHSQFIY